MSVVDLVLQMALGMVLTAWVVKRDMRGASPEWLQRSWNVASFWSAVVAFGPFCIPVHFARTRRSVLGFLIGIGWTALVLGVISLVAEALAFVTGH